MVTAIEVAVAIHIQSRWLSISLVVKVTHTKLGQLPVPSSGVDAYDGNDDSRTA